MIDSSNRSFNRRNFLSGISTVGAAALLGLPRPAAAEPPPETKKIRLVHVPSICLAPQYLAEEFLRLEGFSEVEYVTVNKPAGPDMLLANLADISVHTPPSLLPDLDAGKPFVVLAGLHGGCYELFANEPVRAVRDLKGKRIGVSMMGGVEYWFIAAMLAYVGMDPRKDIEWVEVKGYDNVMPQFIDGKVDAFLAFVPQPQYLRARKIGRVILDTTQDRPWKEYFCCMIAARKDFVTKNPVATKRAMRAILKATDVCARDPERAARYIVAKEYEPSYDVALEVIKSLPYDRWRTYNPEDSLRFYGVRLHEAGLIKTSPQKLIAQGTDWRFLNELKRELKA